MKGDTLPAAILDDMRNWRLVWDPVFNPGGIVISQRLDIENNSQLVKWQNEVIAKFFSTQEPGTPSLLIIDEGMDFFGPTGNALHGNIVQRCWRAGGEKGMSCLIGLQRPKTINLQMLTESNLLYLFRLRYEEDVERLREMGFPKGVTPPTEKYQFLFFKDDHLYPKPVQLQLGE